MKKVNFIEAIKSGKRYREFGSYGSWKYAFIGLEDNQTKVFTYNQIIADYNYNHLNLCFY